MSYKNRGRRRFTEREKRAYSAGKGYAAAKAGKRVACKTENEKQSFRNGVNAVRGKKKATRVSRTREIVCGITADGEIVKVK